MTTLERLVLVPYIEKRSLVERPSSPRCNPGKWRKICLVFLYIFFSIFLLPIFYIILFEYALHTINFIIQLNK